jgi:hypothetical protein
VIKFSKVPVLYCTVNSKIKLSIQHLLDIADIFERSEILVSFCLVSFDFGVHKKVGMAEDTEIAVLAVRIGNPPLLQEILQKSPHIVNQVFGS